MRKAFVFILCVTFMVSCKNESKVKGNESLKTHKTSITDTIFFKNDTIIGIEKISNNGAVFHWGINDDFLISSNDTIPFSISDKSKLKFSEGYAYIEGGCGSGCNYIYLMSFNEIDKDFFRLYPLTMDLTNNIIVYKSENFETLLTTENLKTNVKEEFIEDYNRNNRPETFAVDSIALNNKKLFIRWYKENNDIDSRIIDL